MDLRGLDAKSLSMLLGGATDLRTLKVSELDQEQDRQLRLLDLMTRTEKAERPTTTLSATYMKDGKLVKDRIENGQVVGQVDAPPNEHGGGSDPGGRWFQSADGQVRYFTGSNPPPAGWGAVEDPTTAALRDILVGDKLNARDSKLAGYETVLQSGKVGGREVDSETLNVYKDLYNKQNLENEFVEQVTPPLTIGGWKVPFTGKKELVKVPKDSTKSDGDGNAGGAPPVGTVDSGYKFKGGNPADPNNWEKM
jgi:hypothetical protein